MIDSLPDTLVKTTPNGNLNHENDHALQVHQLAAGYPGDRRAITQISFSVNKGERIAIIGPNGAGKSTLFKAIVGLIPFTEGSISIHGEDCRTSHNLVGYVPQQEAIDWSFPVTVFDVIMMGRARQIGWFRQRRRKDIAVVHQLIEQFSFQHLASRQIGELSGGQRRRVFIARALAQETDVILLDEPFNGVDTLAEQEIMDALDILTSNGITILLATHDIDKAARHFDRMMLLKQEILAFGTPDTVLKPEILKAAYGGTIQVFQQGTESLIVADDNCCGD